MHRVHTPSPTPPPPRRSPGARARRRRRLRGRSPQDHDAAPARHAHLPRAGGASALRDRRPTHPTAALPRQSQVGGAQWALLWPRPQLAPLYSGLGPALLRSARGVSRGSLRDPSQNLPPLNRSLCPRFTVGESWLESGRSGRCGEIRGDTGRSLASPSARAGSSRLPDARDISPGGRDGHLALDAQRTRALGSGVAAAVPVGTRLACRDGVDGAHRRVHFPTRHPQEEPAGEAGPRGGERPSHASSLAPCPCPLALPSALSDLSRPRPRPDTAPPWPSCLQADGGSFPALARRLLLRGGWPRLYSGYGPRLAMQAVSGGLWNWVFVRGQELFSSQGWT